MKMKGLVVKSVLCLPASVSGKKNTTCYFRNSADTGCHQDREGLLGYFGCKPGPWGFSIPEHGIDHEMAWPRGDWPVPGTVTLCPWAEETRCDRCALSEAPALEESQRGASSGETVGCFVCDWYCHVCFQLRGRGRPQRTLVDLGSRATRSQRWGDKHRL